MPDYVKAIGSTGSMMLRDTGVNAEFWLKAGPLTSCYNKPWGYTANGATNHNLDFDYLDSGNWVRIGYLKVSTSQTVDFWIGATGTNGLDGPANISGYFQRATVPLKPINLKVYNIWSTTCTTQFSSGGDGGSPVDQWQMTYNTNSNGGQWTYASNGVNNLTGLTPGQAYWFWARGHNALGWGPWAGPFGWTQLRQPDPPSAPVISEITQTTAKATWTPNGTGGSAITNQELHYRTTLDDQGNTTILSGSPPKSLTGMQPGILYYFWTRAQNAIGWSALTGPVMQRMVAGAVIKEGVDYKYAVPYVKVAGVWKLARPWINSNEVWKESQ